MPERLPVLSILPPLPNSVVGNAPFNVMGSVSTGSITEPVSIDAVVVEIIGQPGTVKATLGYIPPSGNQPAQVTFKTAMQITGGQDPHTVAISVKSDAGMPVTGFVTVTVGPRLVPPSAWMDIQIAPVVLSRDPSLQPAQLAVDPSLQKLLATVAQAMSKLSIVQEVLDNDWMIVGPNVVPLSNPPGLRVGFWIVEANFAPQDLIYATPDSLVPQMTPAAAAGCLDPVPPLPQPSYDVNVGPAEFTAFTFALSLPTQTIQMLVDAHLPTLNREAGRHNASIDSITVQTGSENALIGQVSGSYFGISISGTVTETLGRSQRAGTQSNMAAVVLSSASSPLLDVLSVLLPILGTGIAAIGEGYVQGKAQSGLAGILAKVPAWLPFRNSTLGSGSSPNSLQKDFPFPMLVLNFDSFGTDASGVIGSGTGGLASRLQSGVSVNLSGAKSLAKYSPGSGSTYDVALIAFEPDNDQMTWQVSGGGSTGTFDTDPFLQEGSFSTVFPISSGSETFTLSVKGTETCATDSTQTLTASASLPVHVAVPEEHKAEAAPAPNANARAAEDTARVIA